MEDLKITFLKDNTAVYIFPIIDGAYMILHKGKTHYYNPDTQMENILKWIKESS